MNQLNIASSWSLILNNTYQVVVTNPEKNWYKPLNPIVVSAQNRIILAGVTSTKAKPHWYLGAWVTAQINISPSTQAGFYGFVQSKEVQKVPLHKLALLEFETYQLPTYSLVFTFPYWLEDATLEVWQYTGTEPDVGNLPTAVQQKIVELQQQLNDLASWGT